MAVVMKNRDRGLIHFVAAEVLVVIVVLTAQGILQTGIGIILAMFSFGSMLWIAINDKEEEEEEK